MKIACMDCTVTVGLEQGKLVAYRWDGEQEISPDAFVWV